VVKGFSLKLYSGEGRITAVPRVWAPQSTSRTSSTITNKGQKTLGSSKELFIHIYNY
jgi:hypothetical protein